MESWKQDSGFCCGQEGCGNLVEFEDGKSCVSSVQKMFAALSRNIQERKLKEKFSVSELERLEKGGY